MGKLPVCFQHLEAKGGEGRLPKTAVSTANPGGRLGMEMAARCLLPGERWRRRRCQFTRGGSTQNATKRPDEAFRPQAVQRQGPGGAKTGTSQEVTAPADKQGPSDPQAQVIQTTPNTTRSHSSYSGIRFAKTSSMHTSRWIPSTAHSV